MAATFHLIFATLGFFWGDADMLMVHLLSLFIGTDVVLLPELWICNSASGLPTAQDLSPFRLRAGTIRELSWSEPEGYCMSCFYGLSHSLRSSSSEDLVPNLRSLRIICRTTWGLLGIQQWIPSTILELAVEVGNGVSYQAVQALMEVITRCTYLQRLMLRWSSEAYTPSQVLDLRLQFAEMCRNLKSLQQLEPPVDFLCGAGFEDLRRLTIICANLRELFVQVPFERPVNIIPLSQYTRLEKLEVRAPHPLIISDYDLREMLGRWSRIRYLSLNPRPSLRMTPGTSQLTIGCLVAVAQSGPLLEYFGAYIHIENHLALPADIMTWELLESLDLGSSSCGCNDIDCEVQVASNLVLLFPRVRIEVEEGSSPWVRRLARSFEGLRTLLEA